MTKNISHKKRRTNPHTIWVAICTGFMVALILLLVGSSWYFARVTKELDAPGTPVLETNAVKIQTMQEVVDRVEGAIEKRTSQ